MITFLGVDLPGMKFIQNGTSSICQFVTFCFFCNPQIKHSASFFFYYAEKCSLLIENQNIKFNKIPRLIIDCHNIGTCMQHSSSSRSLHWYTENLRNWCHLLLTHLRPQLNTPSSCQKRRGNMVLSNSLNFSTISLDPKTSNFQHSTAGSWGQTMGVDSGCLLWFHEAFLGFCCANKQTQISAHHQTCSLSQTLSSYETIQVQKK